MKKIYKYKLNHSSSQPLQLPKGSSIISVTSQYGNIVLYANVQTDAKETETYDILVIGTGDEAPSKDYHFIGTIKLHEGAYMFHVFYKKEE